MNNLIRTDAYRELIVRHGLIWDELVKRAKDNRQGINASSQIRRKAIIAADEAIQALFIAGHR